MWTRLKHSIWMCADTRNKQYCFTSTLLFNCSTFSIWLLPGMFCLCSVYSGPPKVHNATSWLDSFVILFHVPSILQIKNNYWPSWILWQFAFRNRPIRILAEIIQELPRSCHAYTGIVHRNKPPAVFLVSPAPPCIKH